MHAVEADQAHAARRIILIPVAEAIGVRAAGLNDAPALDAGEVLVAAFARRGVARGLVPPVDVVVAERLEDILEAGHGHHLVGPVVPAAAGDVACEERVGEVLLVVERELHHAAEVLHVVVDVGEVQEDELFILIDRRLARRGLYRAHLHVLQDGEQKLGRVKLDYAPGCGTCRDGSCRWQRSGVNRVRAKHVWRSRREQRSGQKISSLHVSVSFLVVGGIVASRRGAGNRKSAQTPLYIGRGRFRARRGTRGGRRMVRV